MLSLETASPAFALSQHDALSLAVRLSGAEGTRARALGRLYDGSGVGMRRVSFLEDSEHRLYTDEQGSAHDPTTAERMARYVTSATPMATSACEEAIGSASVQPADITHLVTASCTGFANPGVELSLVRKLGLAPNVQRAHIGFMGCHGAINALRVAKAIAASDDTARVLVCCVEACSLHYQFSGPRGSMVANALFGDGAAACVVAQSTQHGLVSIDSTHSTVVADSESDMGWQIGDHGFVMELSPRVPSLIEKSIAGWLGSFCDPQDLGGCIIHPGGPKVIDAVLEGAELPASMGEASCSLLHDYGNMSSPTVLFILRRMLDSGVAGTVPMLAFGPGLTCEGAMLTLPKR